MESLSNVLNFLKVSFGLWRRVERLEDQNANEDQNVNEAQTTIRRVASRLQISEDIATVLLVFFHWDENKIDSEFISGFFVSNPEDDHSTMNCHMCDGYDECVNLGCGHYSCDTCVNEHIEARIVAGELDLFCPHVECLKFLSHSRIKRLLSEDALATYHHRLFENWRCAQPQDSLITKVVSLLRKGTGLGSSLASSLGYSNKELIFVAFLFVLYETKSRLKI